MTKDNVSKIVPEITGIKQTERKLRTSEERCRRLLGDITFRAENEFYDRAVYIRDRARGAVLSRPSIRT